MALSLSGLSAVYPGYLAGERAGLDNNLQQLRVRAAQEDLRMQTEQREQDAMIARMAMAGADQGAVPGAQPMAGGVPMPNGPMPQLPMGPQPPQPGQPSVSSDQAPPGAQPMPGASPGGAAPTAQPPQPMGAQFTPQAVAASAPANAAAQPGSPASPFAPGNDLNTIIQRLAAANPRASADQLFRAATRYYAIMNPQQKLEMQYAIQQLKSETAMANMQATLEYKFANMDRLIKSQEDKLTQQRELAKMADDTRREIAAAKDQQVRDGWAAMSERIQELQNRLDTRQTQKDTAQATREQERDARRASLQGMKGEQAQALALTKGAIKAGNMGETLSSAADEAEKLAYLARNNPDLVGFTGNVQRLLGSVGEQTGLTEPPKEANEYKQRVLELQRIVRTNLFSNRTNMSTNAQRVLEQYLPSLGNFDSADISAGALELIANVMREEAKRTAAPATMRVSPGGMTPAAPAPGAAPAPKPGAAAPATTPSGGRVLGGGAPSPAAQTSPASSAAGAPAAAPGGAAAGSGRNVGDEIPGPGGVGVYKITGFDPVSGKPKAIKIRD